MIRPMACLLLAWSLQHSDAHSRSMAVNPPFQFPRQAGYEVDD